MLRLLSQLVYKRSFNEKLISLPDIFSIQPWQKGILICRTDNVLMVILCLKSFCPGDKGHLNLFYNQFYLLLINQSIFKYLIHKYS